MMTLLGWIFYGLVVGIIAKAIHPGEDPEGFLPTIGIGVVGSFLGGFVNYILGQGQPFSSSGILMGVVGGVVACAVWRWYKLNNATGGARDFWTGKRK